MKTPPAPTSYVRELESKNFDLRAQLTAALAERDEAREQLRISERQLANRIEAYSALSEITYGIEQERDTLAAQLDTAWQQGAEAMREAAANIAVDSQSQRNIEGQGYTSGSNARLQCFAQAREARAIDDAIRALPVPERKEG